MSTLTASQFELLLTEAARSADLIQAEHDLLHALSHNPHQTPGEGLHPIGDIRVNPMQDQNPPADNLAQLKNGSWRNGRLRYAHFLIKDGALTRINRQDNGRFGWPVPAINSIGGFPIELDIFCLAAGLARQANLCCLRAVDARIIRVSSEDEIYVSYPSAQLIEEGLDILEDEANEWALASAEKTDLNAEMTILREQANKMQQIVPEFGGDPERYKLAHFAQQAILFYQDTISATNEDMPLRPSLQTLLCASIEKVMQEIAKIQAHILRDMQPGFFAQSFDPGMGIAPEVDPEARARMLIALIKRIGPTWRNRIELLVLNPLNGDILDSASAKLAKAIKAYGKDKTQPERLRINVVRAALLAPTTLVSRAGAQVLKQLPVQRKFAITLARLLGEITDAQTKQAVTAYVIKASVMPSMIQS